MGRLNSTTRLYCVFGNPVVHSLSPTLHNAAFAHYQVNGAYLAFSPPDIGQGVAAMRSLDIKGASVTIPFKESIISHLDWIHPLAERIGAVNTVVNDHGRLKGYNTDCEAAVAPLEHWGIQDKTILLLGAGGAAKAVAHGIRERGGTLLIANRSLDKADRLARACGARTVSMDELDRARPDMIINTTPVGMESSPGLSCPKACMEARPVVMDAVYTPLDTPLIIAARDRGCQVVDGLSMFVAQAAAQFELWTKIRPNTEKMKHWVMEDLLTRKESHPDKERRQ